MLLDQSIDSFLAQVNRLFLLHCSHSFGLFRLSLDRPHAETFLLEVGLTSQESVVSISRSDVHHLLVVLEGVFLVVKVLLVVLVFVKAVVLVTINAAVCIGCAQAI